MKVICFDEKNQYKYKEVEVKQSFPKFGYTWCVHRPPNQDKIWVVSEYKTGMKCSAPENTQAAAIREAEKKLDEMGEARTEKAIKLAIKQRGVVNESV